MDEVVLAVDIGGTKTAAALADRHDRLLRTEVAATPAAEGPSAVVATVVALTRRLLAGSELRLSGVGVGTAGVVDAGRGTIVSATDTFADWPGTPLAALVRAGLDGYLLPDACVEVQNDVDAHALGEYRHGAAAGAPSALVVAVGTGVGAGLLVHDQAIRGAHHVAGEIAHMPVPGAAHLRCPCGRHGHLEAIGSGIGMHRHFLSLGGDPDLRDARDIVTAVAAGDPIARRALDESAAAVGRALAGAATLLDPERIVVTGGVPKIGEDWWRPMRAAFHAEAIDALQHTPILPGTLGDDAPLRGAAASAWRNP
ncbi:ROK family protein [Microbacterium paraoxydans]|uniref:ROK family protein n=1 Tax=Microbacterium paraoxydans TaxID=199592 RepID=UPI001CFA72F2|nr:ROK family protein [Microbacterium paraoxydans]